jgi:hypothetical protein
MLSGAAAYWLVGGSNWKAPNLAVAAEVLVTGLALAFGLPYCLALALHGDRTLARKGLREAAGHIGCVSAAIFVGITLLFGLVSLLAK